MHIAIKLCYTTNNSLKTYKQIGDTLDALDLARHIVDVVEDRKAEHITLLDLRPDTVIADFFVIATGNSDRQLRALMDYVREDVKAKHGKVPFSMEGTPESGWIVIDYGDVVVHLFTQAIRDYYDIESLWSHAANVLLSIQ
jgi:ribosome-associated protein